MPTKNEKDTGRNPGGLPMIGIFWWVDENVLAVKLTPAAAPLTEGIRDVETNHHAHWNTIRRKLAGPSGSVPYDYYPRGRIIYREGENQFSIYADRCILADPVRIKRIVEEFSLTNESVEATGDFHYQCSRCNKDYLSFDADEK